MSSAAPGQVSCIPDSQDLLRFANVSFQHLLQMNMLCNNQSTEISAVQGKNSGSKLRIAIVLWKGAQMWKRMHILVDSRRRHKDDGKVNW